MNPLVSGWLDDFPAPQLSLCSLCDTTAIVVTHNTCACLFTLHQPGRGRESAESDASADDLGESLTPLAPTSMPTKPDFKGALPHRMAGKVHDASADGIGVRGIERNRDNILNDDHGGAHSSRKGHRSHPVSNAGPQGLLGSPRPESEEQQSGMKLTEHLQQILQSSKAPDTPPFDNGRGD